LSIREHFPFSAQEYRIAPSSLAFSWEKTKIVEVEKIGKQRTYLEVEEQIEQGGSARYKRYSQD